MGENSGRYRSYSRKKQAVSLTQPQKTRSFSLGDLNIPANEIKKCFIDQTEKNKQQQKQLVISIPDKNAGVPVESNNSPVKSEL